VKCHHIVAVNVAAGKLSREIGRTPSGYSRPSFLRLAARLEAAPFQNKLTADFSKQGKSGFFPQALIAHTRL
jgi:hypothetical protein